MERKQLLIYGQVPSPESLEKLKKFSTNDPCSWTLFPVNSIMTMPEKIKRIESVLSPLGSIRWVDDLHSRFDRAVALLGDRLAGFAQAVRNTIVEEKTIMEHLSGTDMLDSAWWFSLLQERNPLLFPGWNDWAMLSMIEAYLEENEFDRIVIVDADSLLIQAIQQVIEGKTGETSRAFLTFIQPCDGNKVRQSRGRSGLRDFLSGIKEWWSLGRRMLQSRQLARTSSSRSLSSASIIHVGYFPAADPVSGKDVVFRNKYLGELQQLMETDSGSLGFLFYTVPNQTWPFRKCLDEIGIYRKAGYSMAIQEEYLGLMDWIRLIFCWIRLFFKCIRLLKPVLKALVANGTIRKSEQALFTTIWNESFRSHLAVKGFFNFFSFHHFLGTLPIDTQVIYSAEFQSWEYMLNVAAYSAGDHPLIAAIQGNPARNYFQYRFDQKKRETGAGFPERIVSFSPAFDSLNGLQDAQILKGSAIRLMHLEGFQSRIVERRESKKSKTLGILGAGSYDECVLMLEMLFAALKDAPTDLQIKFRSHPVISNDRLAKLLSFDLQKSGITIYNGSMNDLLLESVGIYVSNSTSALEALAYGCEIISPRYFGSLSLCPLEGHEAYYWRVKDEMELTKTINRIMLGEKRASTDAVCQFITEQVVLDKSYSNWRKLIRNE